MQEVSLSPQIVEEARRWIGTPFEQGRRELGRGVDCTNLLVGVLQNLGLIGPFEAKRYDARFWREEGDPILENMLNAIFQLRYPNCARKYEHPWPMPFGSFVTVSPLRRISKPTHAGIVTGASGGLLRMLHASTDRGVVEEFVPASWQVFYGWLLYARVPA